jgi:hypothetical protein
MSGDLSGADHWLLQQKNIKNEHISGSVLLVGGTLGKSLKHEITKEIPRTESEVKKKKLRFSSSKNRN